MEIVIHPLTHPVWLRCAYETDQSRCSLLLRSGGLVMDSWEAKYNSGNLNSDHKFVFHRIADPVFQCPVPWLIFEPQLHQSIPYPPSLLSHCHLACPRGRATLRTKVPGAALSSLFYRTSQHLLQLWEVIWYRDQVPDIIYLAHVLHWKAIRSSQVVILKSKFANDHRAGSKSKDFYRCLSLAVLFHLTFHKWLKDMGLHFQSEHSRRQQKGL